MKYILILTLATYALLSSASMDRPLGRSIDDKNLKWGPCPELFPKGCEIGVLHGNPARKNTDVFFRVPSQYEIPPHTHTSAEHMALLSGELAVKYKGEEEMLLKEGSYAYGPAKRAHRAKCVSEESCVLFISFDEPIYSKSYSGKL